MTSVPKKVSERYKNTVTKFQKILESALDRDVNEADTVGICKDIISEVYGFDKYSEITSEYAIRGTFCDLAVKYDDKIQYLIEVKAIGITLKENHLKQAIDYGANKGVKWIVLTNGIVWELYNIKFERPINYQLVCSFNFMSMNPRKVEDQEKLFLFSKKGISKSAREDYYERIQSFNRFVVSSVIQSEPVVKVIKNYIKKLSSGIKIESSDVLKILRNEVLKREVLDGEDAIAANNRVNKLLAKPRINKKRGLSKKEDSQDVNNNDNKSS